MRILSVGNFSNPSWDGSLPDEEHIAKALEDMGHEVIRRQREEATQIMVNDGKIDFTLIAQWDGYPDALLWPRPMVYWCYDYQKDEQEWHERLIKTADLYLSKQLTDAKYPNWQWLPADFAPAFMNRKWGMEYQPDKEIDVLFTGTYLPEGIERTELLKVVDKEFNLEVYSMTPDAWRDQGLKNVHGPVMDEGLRELIPRAKVNLSIDLFHSPGFWSDRNAQIMACGGAVLFRYVPLSEVVFRDAVQYFYNTEDCLQQLRWLLSQDLTALEMYGWNFAHQNLMVQHRVGDLLTIVKAHL